MDFYYAMTNYHVLCCLLHKIVFNKNKAVLYISSYLTKNQPNIVSKIRKNKIFDQVHVYDEIEFKRTTKKMNKEELNKEIKRICQEVKKSIGEPIKKSNDFYLCSDFYSIGIYLISNKIKYNYFEDGCGTLSRPIMPFRIIEKDNSNRAAIVKRLKSFGENDYTIKRYGNLESQEQGYYNEKDIDFNVEKILSELSSKTINQLLDIYDVKKIELGNSKADLLLTMHYNEIMTEDQQKDIYSLLLDYFAEKKEQIIVKPHPADSIQNYGKIFKGVIEVNRYMPAELFPYCISKDFNKGITCWSTAIYSLKKIINDIVSFDIRIDETYLDFDKYYAIIMYLKELNNQEIINLKLVDINEIQFNNLLRMHFKDYRNFFVINSDDEDKETIYIANKIENDNSKKVISLTGNFTTDATICIRKKYKNENKVDFISLHNLERKNMNINFEHIYSKYSMNITVIGKEDYSQILYNIIENDDKVIINSLKREKSKQEKEIKEKNNCIKEYKRNLKEYENIIEELKNVVIQKNEEIDNLKNTTSWKITKPMRKVIDIIRNIKRKK